MNDMFNVSVQVGTEINNFINLMRREKIVRKDAFYRLLDTSLPTIQVNKKQQDRYSRSTLSNYETAPEDYAEKILRSHQFLYIDLDQESCCRPMEKSQVPEEESEQVEKVGRNYISNLRFLSSRNQQTIDYLQKSKQLLDQKQSIRKMLKNEMDRSLEKLKIRKNYRANYSSVKKQKQVEYDPLKLRQLIEEQAFQALNQNVWDKEKRLIEKFGIVSNYLSNNKSNEKALMQSRKIPSKKIQLPSIAYRTIQK